MSQKKQPETDLEFLKEMLMELKVGSSFQFSQDRDRLWSALADAGMTGTFVSILEWNLLPGATLTQRIFVPPDFVFCPWTYYISCSLPWFARLTGYYPDMDIVLQQGLIATFYQEQFVPGLFPFKQYWRLDVTNLHPLNSVQVQVAMRAALFTTGQWDVVKRAYFDPIVKYTKEVARGER